MIPEGNPLNLGVGPNKKFGTLLDLCVSSLRRGHANLLCIVPILTDDPRRESATLCSCVCGWSTQCLGEVEGDRGVERGKRADHC